MIVASKLMAAATSTVALGTAGTALWMNAASAPPTRDLSTDDDFKTVYANKYAFDYAKYFVGVGQSTKHKNINVDKWWDWIFKYKYSKVNQENLKSNFKNKKSSSELKNACRDAYKANSEKNEEQDIWSFCSIGGNKPIPIEKSSIKSYSPNSYINDSKGKKYLISAWNRENDWFWKIKEKEFSEASLDSLKRGSVFRGNKNFGFFSFLADGIKAICRRAYWESEAFAEHKFPKQEIYRFCSLKGKVPNN